MLGRASWMRLPEIVGVKLGPGQRQPGITATDVVLALTEFLRRAKVVGAYLEFYGGRIQVDDWRPRHHLEHGPRIRRDRRAVQHRPQTLDYLTLTGRSAEQVRLVETYASKQACGPQPAGPRTERDLTFDLCPAWCANGRPQPARPRGHR